MKEIKTLLAMTALLVFAASCEDEERLPQTVLTTIEKGAYPRLLDESEKEINFFDLAGSSYTYEIEFVDLEGGDLVEEYVVDLVFEDNTPENGDKSSGPYEFLKLDASQFEEGDNGFLKPPSITIQALDALEVAGLTEEDVGAGDNFKFQGRIMLTSGRVFSHNNSSSTIVGPVFRGHFDYTLSVFCPSKLEGEYEYSNTETWCGVTYDGTVEILELGDGVYTFGDWSLGAYDACYEAVSSAWGNMSFTDECAEVSFTGFTDNYGDTWSFESFIEGDDWVITWNNTTYTPEEGGGTSHIHFPDGVPFTLAE